MTETWREVGQDHPAEVDERPANGGDRMSPLMITWDEFFDPDGDNPLQLTEDEQKDFKAAILDLNYEELFKPLLRRQEELLRNTKRNNLFLIVLVILLLISIALNLIRLW